MADNINTQDAQTKKKIMIVVIIIIFLIIGWQLKAMLFTSSTPTQSTPLPATAANNTRGTAMPAEKGAPSGLKEAPFPSREATMTEGEKRLFALQMQTEAKYIAAMNELQLLRVQSEIAKNSKDIAQNRLDAVTAQTQTLQLLSAPQATAATYAQGLSGGGGLAMIGATPHVSPVPQHAEIAYVVVSVSQLQHRWAAVLGYQGQLYHVVIGDVLSPDSAKVVGIDRAGVTLDRDGKQQRISLVSLI